MICLTVKAFDFAGKIVRFKSFIDLECLLKLNLKKEKTTVG